MLSVNVCSDTSMDCLSECALARGYVSHTGVLHGCRRYTIACESLHALMQCQHLVTGCDIVDHKRT